MRVFTTGVGRTCLAVAVIGAACALPADAAKIGETLDEVTALAKKERAVQVANSWRGPVLNEVTKGFKKKHGLTFKQSYVGGIDSRERILSEALAGLMEYDLVNVSGELRPQYIKASIITPIEWSKLFPGIQPALFDPKGHFVAAGMSRYGIIYNTKLVSSEKVPKRWEDCLDPVWKGKMAVYTRPRTFTGLWPGWGEEKSLAFHRKLKDNGPIWTADQTGTAAKLAAGEYSFVCGLPYHTFLTVKRRDKTAPIAFVTPTELPIQVGEAFAVMKGAKNPNSAILFAAYMASTEGQAAHELYGRGNPFVEGTFANDQVKEAGAKLVFGGWEFAGALEAQAAKKIVEAWGFPKGR